MKGQVKEIVLESGEIITPSEVKGKIIIEGMLLPRGGGGADN